MSKRREEIPDELPPGFTGELTQEELTAIVRHCRDLHYEATRLADEVDGLESTIRQQAGRISRLQRNREAEAKAHPLWPLVKDRLFPAWVKAANKDPKRTRFRADRFELIRPFLRPIEKAAGKDGSKIPAVSYDKDAGPPQNVIEECFAAIIGCTYDPFVTERRNGTKNCHTGWDLIFRDSPRFEEKQRQRPRDWRERMRAIDPEAP
jgi:hypothetical protein